MGRFHNIDFVKYWATMSFEISTADEILSIGLFDFHSDGSRERGGQRPQRRLNIIATAAS